MEQREEDWEEYGENGDDCDDRIRLSLEDAALLARLWNDRNELDGPACPDGPDSFLDLYCLAHKDRPHDLHVYSTLGNDPRYVLVTWTDEGTYEVGRQTPCPEAYDFGGENGQFGCGLIEGHPLPHRF